MALVWLWAFDVETRGCTKKTTPQSAHKVLKIFGVLQTCVLYLNYVPIYMYSRYLCVCIKMRDDFE